MTTPFRVVVRCVVMSWSVIGVAALHAAPAHIIRFSAAGQRDACFQVQWGSMLLLYNSTGSTARVRVLGISNGPAQSTSPDVIEVPPGQVVSANHALGGAWIPASKANIWMMHLDIPEGIVVENRDEMFMRFHCIQAPIGDVSLGKVSLPIFREATPANQPQVYLGTDVGGLVARINVGIYNAGGQTAKAHVEVRRVCDNSVVDQRDVEIPPDTIVQAANFVRGEHVCTANANWPTWMRYTVITVDQPSMTYALAVTETTNALTGLAPNVGLSIPMNVRF